MADKEWALGSFYAALHRNLGFGRPKKKGHLPRLTEKI